MKFSTYQFCLTRWLTEIQTRPPNSVHILLMLYLYLADFFLLNLLSKVESDLRVTIILVSSAGSKMMQQTKVNTFENKCLPKLASLISEIKGSGITMNSCTETPLDTSFFNLYWSFPTICIQLG